MNKKLSEQDKNKLSIMISQVIKHINENYYDNRFKI